MKKLYEFQNKSLHNYLSCIKTKVGLGLSIKKKKKKKNFVQKSAWR